MKFQTMIRTQLVIAGFVAALSFAGAAKAQEIENTTFDDGPYVASFTQPVSLQDAFTAPTLPILPSSQTTPTMAPIGASTMDGWRILRQRATTACRTLRVWFIKGRGFDVSGSRFWASDSTSRVQYQSN